ncbi:MAG: complex I NDUFA9 subunit family protein [Nitrospirae bacterium]|nr:complex I NDUFA9 subunit family protein [Nitrospirota bacterium]
MIFIAGASGFAGGHLSDFLLAKGHKLKCLARSKRALTALAEKGAEVIPGDITQAVSLQGVLRSDDIVIHLVGIIEERGDATFQSIHVEGTKNLVKEAQRAGVKHFFYQSALGSDISSWSGYLKTKAEAEEIVKQSGIAYTIFRPSLIIGPWDGFTKKIMDMLKFSPVVPLPGEGKAKFQPIYIKDWLTCIGRVIDDPARYSGTFDIGGPEHLAYREIVENLSKAMGHRRPTFSIPMGFMKLSTSILERFLPSPPVTSDQLRLLEQDNICDLDAVERHFGFMPKKFADALQEFMP